MNIYNCHTHSFTLDHVPDKIFKFLPVNIARKTGFFKWLMKNLPRIFKSGNDILDRYASLLALINEKNQEEVFEKVLKSYPKGTKFVFLSMDMEHMNAGKPAVCFLDQLEELAGLKKKYNNILFPFICADPRNENVTKLVKDFISNKGFQGIKLYPALGFYIFDYRLHEIYRFAIENNIPVIVHCAKGVIYDRAKISETARIHPVTGQLFNEKKKRCFTTHYGNPVNLECLLNTDKLQIYMDKFCNGAKAPDFSKLKICLAHFGGDDEWEKYLNTPWNPLANYSSENTNWFSEIRDLIFKYDNVYSDISFSLANEKIFPLLKIMLEEGYMAINDDTTEEEKKKKKLRERILFGTDYFLVEQKSTERNLVVNLRAFISDDNFIQIAEKNPKEFLSNKFYPNI